MQNQRTRHIPYDRVRRVEAAVLALLLAEDWPWRPSELAERLLVPDALIAVSEATLRADGLAVSRRGKLRASWAAVRGDELAHWQDSIKRRACLTLEPGRAIPLH